MVSLTAWELKRNGKHSEYPHLTDHGDSSMDGFHSLLPTHLYRNYAVETPSVPTILAPITGEGMKGAKEIAG